MWWFDFTCFFGSIYKMVFEKENKIFFFWSYPHPFISILSVAKGKKVIPRVLRHCLPEQILTLITMLVANFESLDVCKGAVWGTQGNVSSRMLEEVELFMNTVVPPLLQFVAEAPLRIILGLFGLFIERNNIVCVARSKVCGNLDYNIIYLLNLRIVLMKIFLIGRSRIFDNVSKPCWNPKAGWRCYSGFTTSRRTRVDSMVIHNLFTKPFFFLIIYIWFLKL